MALKQIKTKQSLIELFNSIEKLYSSAIKNVVEKENSYLEVHDIQYFDFISEMKDLYKQWVPFSSCVVTYITQLQELISDMHFKDKSKANVEVIELITSGIQQSLFAIHNFTKNEIPITQVTIDSPFLNDIKIKRNINFIKNYVLLRSTLQTVIITLERNKEKALQNFNEENAMNHY